MLSCPCWWGGISVSAGQWSWSSSLQPSSPSGWACAADFIQPDVGWNQQDPIALSAFHPAMWFHCVQKEDRGSYCERMMVPQLCWIQLRPLAPLNRVQDKGTKESIQGAQSIHQIPPILTFKGQLSIKLELVEKSELGMRSRLLFYRDSPSRVDRLILIS